LELSEIPAHFLEFLLPSRYCEVGFRERVGVCRDFTHLAFTLCRCMNIPARYATGYLGDIGVAPDPNPMDFSAWFESSYKDNGIPLTLGITVVGLGEC
jgi:hypothetical protein